MFFKCVTSSFQDKKDFIDKRVERLLKAGVTSALAVMVKADSSILTDQTKELLSRWVSNNNQRCLDKCKTVVSFPKYLACHKC